MAEQEPNPAPGRGVPGGPRPRYLDVEDRAMRLCSEQMTRIAEALPGDSRVREQLLGNARWWQLSATFPRYGAYPGEHFV